MRWLEFSRRTAAAAAVFLACSGLAGAAPEDDDQDAPKKWQEADVQFPAFPVKDRLQPFYVSAATSNRFFVDPSSVSVGKDGVVRYTLVVEADGGASNVTFEGMRCETRERRIYASGRSDGTWSRARGDRWERIRESPVNRQHAALFLEYFCPGGVIVANAPEAVDALRRGGHPSNRRW